VAERAVVVAIDIHRLHPAINYEPGIAVVEPRDALTGGGGGGNIFTVTNQASDGVRFYRLAK